MEILDPADQKLLAQLERQGKLDNRRVRVLGEAHDTRVARQHLPLLQKGLHCRIGMEGRAFSDYLPRKFITNLTSKETGRLSASCIMPFYRSKNNRGPRFCLRATKHLQKRPTFPPKLRRENTPLQIRKLREICLHWVWNKC